MKTFRQKMWANKISVVSTIIGVAIWLAFMLPQTFIPKSMAPILGGLWHASFPVAAALLGWYYGSKAWHCGFWMLGVQLLMMVVLSGTGNMFPVIIGYYLFLIGICVLAALISGYIRKMVQMRPKNRQT
jgi:hypothetical protein